MAPPPSLPLLFSPPLFSLLSSFHMHAWIATFVVYRCHLSRCTRRNARREGLRTHPRRRQLACVLHHEPRLSTRGSFIRSLCDDHAGPCKVIGMFFSPPPRSEKTSSLGWRAELSKRPASKNKTHFYSKRTNTPARKKNKTCCGNGTFARCVWRRGSMAEMPPFAHAGREN